MPVLVVFPFYPVHFTNLYITLIETPLYYIIFHTNNIFSSYFYEVLGSDLELEIAAILTGIFQWSPHSLQTGAEILAESRLISSVPLQIRHA
jgi:hypothetical protein